MAIAVEQGVLGVCRDILQSLDGGESLHVL